VIATASFSIIETENNQSDDRIELRTAFEDGGRGREQGNLPPNEKRKINLRNSPERQCTKAMLIQGRL